MQDNDEFPSNAIVNCCTEVIFLLCNIFCSFHIALSSRWLFYIGSS
uniref:Uncharacterized protein n=1 Tax=Chrysemys picta bellii TaxID=8478 RepID=A0A8C3F804_CHRPI